MYTKLGAKTGAILEEIMEWEGSVDEFTNKVADHSHFSSPMIWMQLKKNWFVQLKVTTP